MQIASIQTYVIEVPIRQDVVITSALGTHAVSRVTLVRLTTDDGVEGVGEATVTPRWSGETALGAQALIAGYLAPPLLGLALIAGPETADVETALVRMDAAAFANPFAKSAIEAAIWDVKGRAAGAPVYELLGGPVRDLALPIRFSLAAASPEQTAARAVERVAWGHRTLKVKVGGNPEADVARMRAVRQAIGPDVLLTCDANGGWSVRDAVRALHAMADLDLLLAEQPTPREDLDALAAVRRAVDVPIMADEGVFTLFDAQECLRREAADIIAVYPGKNGGILPCKRIVELAARHGVPCAIGSNLELDPGASPMCHVTVACANIAAERYHGDILGPLYQTESVARNPLRLEGGFVHTPTGAGLGVDVDWSAVDRLRYQGWPSPVADC